MSPWHSLHDAFQEYELIQAALNRIASQSTDGWQKEMLQLRRQLQAVLVRLRENALACAHLDAEGDLLKDYQRALSSMRTAVALHQAQWPVVTISNDDASYREARVVLKNATNNFTEVARKVITRLKRQSP